MDKYKTLLKPACGRIIEKKSEFIGYIKPVSTEESALAFISEIKKKHADARHNVYAYILRVNNTTRFSDDGEPHGTAGMPVLDVLRKEGLTDAAVVVTRYFGGTLLGTGGLVRAYTAAVKAALDNAEPVVYRRFTVFSVSLSYSDYSKIEFLLQGEPVLKDNIEYGTDVKMFLAVPDEEYTRLSNNINEITCGKAVFTQLGGRYDYIKI